MEKKPKNQNWFNRLMERRAFQAAFGLAALILAYVFANWAIDSGSLIDYTITFVLIVLGLRELIGALLAKNRK